MVFDKLKTLKEMQDYYQENYKAYHEKTFSIDPSSFLKPLVRWLPVEAFILDVGCSSGRDLLWMKKKDFDVIGFERSPGLAELARENSGSEVIEGDFETYDFSRLSVDGILLVGALVHLPHERFKPVFQNISNCLRRQGKIFISMKEGNGYFKDNHDRIFYLWQNDDLRRIFDELGYKVIDFNRQVSNLRDSDLWLGYVLSKKYNR